MKQGFVESTGMPGENDLAAINRYSRRTMKAEEVFTFSVVLCDNEIDRDLERFSVDALKTLAGLYVGKSGIFDHSMKGRDQIARIYACEAVPVAGRVTRAGEPYWQLKAKAYMPRIERNLDTIGEIDAGIKKEVSVGCSMASVTCSVCGADVRREPCGHKKGNHYRKDGKKVLCHYILSDAADAYEWSFVAVPAQPAAGVTKAFVPQLCGDGDALLKALDTPKGAQTVTLNRQEASQLAKSYEGLRQETQKGREYLLSQIERAQKLAGSVLPEDVLAKTLQALDFDGLLEIKGRLDKQLDRIFPPVRQLAKAAPAVPDEDNRKYMV